MAAARRRCRRNTKGGALLGIGAPFTPMRRLSLTRLRAGRAFAGALPTLQFVCGFLERTLSKAGNLSGTAKVLLATGPACKAPLSPPGWLAPADIGKNPGPRGFCFSASALQFPRWRRSTRLTSATMTCH